MSIIERLEGKFSKNFNESTVLWGHSVREARWTHIFHHHKNASEVKYILDEIHRPDSEYNRNTEKEWLKKIALTADALEKIDKEFIREVAKTAAKLNQERHRGIFSRHSGTPLIFREEIPIEVRETAYLLERAYVSYLDETVAGMPPSDVKQ